MKPILRIILTVVLSVLPIKSFAQTGWHTKYYDRNDQTDIAYYAAQIRGIPVHIAEENYKIKTRMTMMFLCSPRYKYALGMQINLFFDKVPKLSDRRSAGKIDYYPALLVLRKTGHKNPKMAEEVSVFTRTSMIGGNHSLGLLDDWILPILKHDQLIIIMKWNGDPVFAKVPLKGAVVTVNKAMGLCGME